MVLRTLAIEFKNETNKNCSFPLPAINDYLRPKDHSRYDHLQCIVRGRMENNRKILGKLHENMYQMWTSHNGRHCAKSEEIFTVLFSDFDIQNGENNELQETEMK